MARPSWLTGVLDSADKTQDIRIGHGPLPTPDVEHKPLGIEARQEAIATINSQLTWHTSEMSRLIDLRREHQDAIIEQLIQSGIRGEVAK